jgi:streptogramin lyase
MKRLTGLLLVALALGASSASAAKPISGFTYLSEVFPLATPSARAHALVAGPDREFWFAGAAARHAAPFGIAGTLGPIDMAGRPKLSEPAATELAPTWHKPLDGVAVGADGNVWLTSAAGDIILRMTPTGTVTGFPVAVPGSASAALRGPTGIVAGPDGALWFTAEAGDAIGRIDTSGQIKAYPLAHGAAPHAITVGPEGQLWFTESGAGAIGYITTDGRRFTFPLPNPKARPNGIAAAPDGSIWFTESNSPHVGKVTSAGRVVEYKAEAAGPIIFGPNGDLWFGSRNGIGSIAADGALGTTFCFDHCGADVEAFALGPNHELWYAAHSGKGGEIGAYFTPSANIVMPHRGTVTAQGAVHLPISCVGAPHERCTGKSRLRFGGHFAGQAGFVVPVGKKGDLVMRLSAGARRYLAAHRNVRARLYLTVASQLREETNVRLRHGPGHRDRAHHG